MIPPTPTVSRLSASIALAIAVGCVPGGDGAEAALRGPAVASRAGEPPLLRIAEGEPVYDEYGLVPEVSEGELFLPDEVLDRSWPLPEARSRSQEERSLEERMGEGEEDAEPAEGPLDRPYGEADVEESTRIGEGRRTLKRRAPTLDELPELGLDPSRAHRDLDSDPDPLGDLEDVDDYYEDPAEW